MKIGSCEECHDIQNELDGLVKSAHQQSSPPSTTGQELLDALKSTDEQDLARLIETQPFTRILRRAREHQLLTGHLRFWPWLQEPDISTSRN